MALVFQIIDLKKENISGARISIIFTKELEMFFFHQLVYYEGHRFMI